MRFSAGLRLILVAAALIGLLIGPTVVAPMAVAHAAPMATVDAGHDCCGAASGTASDKDGLSGGCLGAGCFMASVALLPSAPGMVFSADRSAEAPAAVAGLEGRSPTPPLEPPRA